jgi:hypothetical protein
MADETPRKPWYNRVSDSIAALRERECADTELLKKISRDIDDLQSRRDGETVTQDGTTVSKIYRHKVVFTVRVDGGTIEVRDVIKPEAKQFSEINVEAALDHMADLMATADWAERKAA